MENEQNIPKAMNNMIQAVRSGLRLMGDKGLYFTTALPSLHKTNTTIMQLSEFSGRFSLGSAVPLQAWLWLMFPA